MCHQHQQPHTITIFFLELYPCVWVKKWYHHVVLSVPNLHWAQCWVQWWAQWWAQWLVQCWVQCLAQRWAQRWVQLWVQHWSEFSLLTWAYQITYNLWILKRSYNYRNIRKLSCTWPTMRTLFFSGQITTLKLGVLS